MWIATLRSLQTEELRVVPLSCAVRCYPMFLHVMSRGKKGNACMTCFALCHLQTKPLIGEKARRGGKNHKKHCPTQANETGCLGARSNLILEMCGMKQGSADKALPNSYRKTLSKHNHILCGPDTSRWGGDLPCRREIQPKSREISPWT